jgi:hypothetical protein
MTLTLELSEQQAAALHYKAVSRGLTLQAWIQELADSPAPSANPFETGYGILAKYGTAPSIEEIAENRRDMFSGFGEDA